MSYLIRGTNRKETSALLVSFFVHRVLDVTCYKECFRYISALFARSLLFEMKLSVTPITSFQPRDFALHENANRALLKRDRAEVGQQQSKYRFRESAYL